VFQRREVQTTAIARIEELVHRRAAKLITKFQIMSRELPRKVIDDVKVAIDARAWNRKRRADVSDATLIVNANLRQAEVALVGDAGVQANRTRIEIVVFGKETLVEAVVTKAQLVDSGRRENFQVRERDEMDRSRRGRVVTRKNIAGQNRERKRLLAGAVKIAPGKLVVVVE